MFNKWFKPKPAKPKTYPITDLIKSIQISRFKNVFSSDYSIFQVSTYCNTIDEYNNILKKIIAAFKSGTILYAKDLPQQIKSVYLRDWFTDFRKCYLEPEKVLSEFLQLTEEFTILYIETETTNNKSFYIEKNLLLTQQYFQNVSLLAQELSGV